MSLISILITVTVVTWCAAWIYAFRDETLKFLGRIRAALPWPFKSRGEQTPD